MSDDDKGLRTSNDPTSQGKSAAARWAERLADADSRLDWREVNDVRREMLELRTGSAPNEPGPGGLSAIGEAARFFAWLKYDASDSERAVLASMVERIRTETADIVSEGKAEVMSELEALRIENEKLRSSAATNGGKTRSQDWKDGHRAGFEQALRYLGPAADNKSVPNAARDLNTLGFKVRDLIDHHSDVATEEQVRIDEMPTTDPMRERLIGKVKVRRLITDKLHEMLETLGAEPASHCASKGDQQMGAKIDMSIVQTLNDLQEQINSLSDNHDEWSRTDRAECVRGIQSLAAKLGGLIRNPVSAVEVRGVANPDREHEGDHECG